MSIKVLSIGSDQKLFEAGSAVLMRIAEYGAMVDELHIIHMCNYSSSLKKKKISKNIWLYPTNSLISILRPLDAIYLGNQIMFDNKFIRGEAVITVQDIESGWAGMKIKNKWKIPLEVQLHTDPFSPYFTGFQNRVRQFFARTVLAKADGIRVVSESLKLKAKSLKLEAEISVLPIYVDREKIENSHVTSNLHTRYPWRFILLAVSRLAPEKNLSLVIKILARVREKFPDIGLVIVGSGSEENRLKTLVKRLKLEDAVAFAGWQNDLASFYKTADAFIQTSLFEGYGLSLVEAGLSGLPVITTPVGIAIELAHGKDAYIYPHDHPELFVEGIIALIENNQERKNLKINLQKTLESKLLSREDYMAKIRDGWESIATKV
ncbi:hypothetical protein A2W43_03235 [Candidatus Nomurabacteria bacterium RIFCSPHIGHO2_12_40_11]|nr:MAG: hypothetical protein A2W43_03235 [Candidatus Nomurabacteria bacterium RIFCSPHIGHO2_12_40_11]